MPFVHSPKGKALVLAVHSRETRNFSRETRLVSRETRHVSRETRRVSRDGGNLHLSGTVRIYNNASNSDTFLECKDYVKFLGVLIDKNLTWKYHIDYMYIASKISRVVGIIS